jgi:hypothetical protein
MVAKNRFFRSKLNLKPKTFIELSTCEETIGQMRHTEFQHKHREHIVAKTIQQNKSRNQ